MKRMLLASAAVISGVVFLGVGWARPAASSQSAREIAPLQLSHSSGCEESSRGFLASIPFGVTLGPRSSSLLVAWR
jgi:hypothetical protein